MTITPSSPDKNTLLAQNTGVALGIGLSPWLNSQYLTTPEAAAYLRKSSSWLLKRSDIPYLKGVPNIYRKTDLDDWFERNKFEPIIG